MGSLEDRFWGWWDRFSEWEPGAEHEKKKPLIQTRASKAREEDPVLATIPREGWYGFRMFVIGSMVTSVVFLVPLVAVAIGDNMENQPTVTYSDNSRNV